MFLHGRFLFRTIRTLILSFALMLGLCIAFIASAQEGSVLGTWQTEAAESGGYLHVEVGSCDAYVCGTIVKAFNKDDEESANYEHLGKQMIFGMQEKSDGVFVKGKIWAPDKDKTYKSKMSLVDGSLLVSGCVAFICREQTWTRVGS